MYSFEFISWQFVLLSNHANKHLMKFLVLLIMYGNYKSYEKKQFASG